MTLSRSQTSGGSGHLWGGMRGCTLPAQRIGSWEVDVPQSKNVTMVLADSVFMGVWVSFTSEVQPGLR
jgi:hypothetical protein